MPLELESKIQGGIDFNRPLTDNDLQMIKQFGRPLSNLELKQMKAGIPFQDIMRAADRANASLQKGLGRTGANAPSKEDKQRAKELEDFKKVAPQLIIGQPISSQIAKVTSTDPFVTGEKSLPPGFKLETEPSTGQLVPIPETHMFDDNGRLVPKTQAGQPVEDTGLGMDSTGTRFQTGDPALDDFLNNQWLPLVEAEFSGDPTAIFDDEVFKNISQRVEAAYGPIYEKELGLAKETFERSKQAIEAEEEASQRSLRFGLSRGQEDITTQRERITEDVRIGKERISRNYQEALAESKAALASRGLAFGGTRQKEESRLGEAKEGAVKDLERTSQRTLSDLATQQARLESDVPFQQKFMAGQFDRSLAELQSGLTQKEADIAGERLFDEEAERTRLRQYGASLLSSPEFI